MNFIKKLSSKNANSSDCCGVEIKELTEQPSDACCSTSEGNGAKDNSCCATTNDSADTSNQACC